MKTRAISIIVSLSLILLVASFINAQVPQLLNYQGKLLKSDGKAEEGTFTIIFSIYSTETGGTALWSETQNNVTITKGVFNVLLGSVSAFPNTLFTGSGARYLAIKVGNEAEMTPRFRLTSVPYAQRAGEADGVKDGSITNAKLANDAVTSTKIQDGQIGNQDLADNAVTSAKIASTQVVKSINNLKDNVSLAAGSNVAITPTGNTITISAQPTGVPIAFATINSSGSVVNGTSNVSGSWDTSYSRYLITIAGQDYFWTSYVTVVTPFSGPLTWETGSIGGKLIVEFYNVSGSKVQAPNGFQFVTFKP
jgi:hypothetical protein